MGSIFSFLFFCGKIFCLRVIVASLYRQMAVTRIGDFPSQHLGQTQKSNKLWMVIYVILIGPISIGLVEDPNFSLTGPKRKLGPSNMRDDIHESPSNVDNE